MTIPRLTVREYEVFRVFQGQRHNSPYSGVCGDATVDVCALVVGVGEGVFVPNDGPHVTKGVPIVTSTRREARLSPTAGKVMGCPRARRPYSTVFGCNGMDTVTLGAGVLDFRFTVQVVAFTYRMLYTAQLAAL